jgi:4-hydroxy-3-methylbut-2-enyl diphosphate reductase
VAVRDISELADVMIIIGGKNSSNTKQLFNIAKERCFDSYHIEDENEIDYTWFADKEFCGVSAGASTPDWIIKNVIDAIRKRVD